MTEFDYNEPERSTRINRRTVLKGIGAVGVVGTIGTDVVVSTDQSECDCPDGTIAWGKYEFEDCEFVFEEGDNFELDGGGYLVEISDWESKEEEDCEPVTVHYEVADGFEVTHICAFGGNDTDTDEDPDGTYESDLVNNGGTQAAISHITFCVGEVEGFPSYQIDLIYGEPIEQFDPDAGVTYNEQNRLLQDYWSGDGLGTHHFHRQSDAYEGCWDDFDNVEQSEAIPTYITVEDGTAIACVEPDDAECLEEFALVSYGAPGDKWDPDTAHQQVLWDTDTTGVVDDGMVCFEVDVPPVE